MGWVAAPMASCFDTKESAAAAVIRDSFDLEGAEIRTSPEWVDGGWSEGVPA